jgi:hypothetical protein
MSAAAADPSPEVLASARLHLETAIGLVGREQVQAWMNAVSTPLIRHVTTTSITTVTQKKGGSTACATGTRGRKAGTVAPPEQRCTWILTTGDQCSNKRKGDNALCGMHVGKIHLVDSSVGDASAAVSDAE